jgi:O-methyltransferase
MSRAVEAKGDLKLAIRSPGMSSLADSLAWRRDKLPALRELPSLGRYRRSQRLWATLHEGGWTMLGPRRGRTLFRLAEEVERTGVRGALVDCGVWNGGSTVLLAAAAPSRQVWAFDSFAGLPEPDAAADGAEAAGMGGDLVGSEEKLRQGFERLVGHPGRLHVRAGWFEDTLEPAAAEIDRVAVLHCDGDWYESVRLTLEVMYPLVEEGGFIVIDDYGTFPGARRATDEFRSGVPYPGPLRRIDHSGRYWRKPFRGTSPAAWM